MEPLQSTLLAQLTQVPDFRKARGQRYAWSYLLAIVTAALVAGQKGVLEMATWAKQHAAELLSTLQPDCPRIPSAATLRRVLCRIDLVALERQVAAYGQALDAADPTAGCVSRPPEVRCCAGKRLTARMCGGPVPTVSPPSWSAWSATAAPISWDKRRWTSRQTRSRWYRSYWRDVTCRVR